MTVLVIAPHPDDESIGCGGALCLHARRGDRVIAVFLTSGELGLKRLPREQAWQIREREARQAARIIGIARVVFLRQPDWLLGDQMRQAASALRPFLKQETPRMVYLPHPADWHPDHQTALPVFRLAFQRSGLRLPVLRAYEIWTPLREYDHVENITAVMSRKLRAVRAHQSQLDGELNYERAVIGLSQYRGALAGHCDYAEVFQTIELPRAK
jgi:LmbE family N-acetylglucosaminyl deacetylase